MPLSQARLPRGRAEGGVPSELLGTLLLLEAPDGPGSEGTGSWQGRQQTHRPCTQRHFQVGRESWRKDWKACCQDGTWRNCGVFFLSDQGTPDVRKRQGPQKDPWLRGRGLSVHRDTSPCTAGGCGPVFLMGCNFWHAFSPLLTDPRRVSLLEPQSLRQVFKIY